LHKNSANRIIALNFGRLMEIFRFFPQGFPPLCAKLNTPEIFFLAHRKKSFSHFAENYCRALLTGGFAGCYSEEDGIHDRNERRPFFLDADVLG
jgi:hypothetical protein